MRISIGMSIVVCLGSLLSACGGGSSQSTPAAEHLAAIMQASSTTPGCAPAWVEGSTYAAGAMVSYSGSNYTALVNQTAWARSA